MSATRFRQQRICIWWSRVFTACLWLFHRCVQVEKAMAAVSEKVDEITIRPEVYGANIEQQLRALVKEHRALSEQVASNATTLAQFAAQQQHNGGGGGVSSSSSSFGEIRPALWAAGGMVVGVAATLAAFTLARRAQ